MVSNVLPADLEDNFDVKPVENGDVSFGEYDLVGHGKVTNENCGRFSGYFYGCDRVDLHNKTDLNGFNHAGKVYVKKPIFHSCNKPSCPICYKYGWVVREAKCIEARLKEASKRFGVVEHLSISVPVKDYGMSLESLRLKVVKLLKIRGVVGSCLIWHGFRYANPVEARRKNIVEGWRWSPHFHALGFILGGYSKCRRCSRKWDCLKGCGNFDDRSYQQFLKDGYYVKVFGKRKSVFWTAHYLLDHATIRKDSVRFQVVTWWGNVSYRKMKVTVELRKAVCPLCKHDLVKLRYNGSKLDTLMLIYGGSCSVDLEEQPEIRFFAKEVVWERVVSSGKPKYYFED